MSVSIVYIDRSYPNPWLWVAFAEPENLGAVSRGPPPIEGDWNQANQFCSILSVDWLLSGQPGTYGIANYSDEAVAAAANQLASFGSLKDQVLYAQGRLGATNALTVDEAVEAMAGAPPGVMIWAGSDEHVVAGAVIDSNSFAFYNSDSGEALAQPRSAFRGILEAFAINVVVMAKAGSVQS